MDRQDPAAQRLLERSMIRLDKSDELQEMKDVEIIKTFIYAGKARISVEIEGTKEYFHMQVERKTEGSRKGGDFVQHDIWWVSLSLGQSVNKFYATGHIVPGDGEHKGKMFFRLNRKCKWIKEDSQVVQSIRYLLKRIHAGRTPRGLKILRGNVCGMCGLKLKVPSSIRGNTKPDGNHVLNQKYGIGPVCRKYMGLH